MKAGLIALACAALWAGPAPAQEAAPPAYRAAEIYGTAAASADPDSVEALVEGQGGAETAPWACASCHGEKGEGKGNIPRLAGLPAGYLAKQMHDYRDGTRRNDNMQYVVAQLDDGQILALARHYEKMDAPATAVPALGGDRALGQRLANEGAWAVSMPACFACHGSLGWGVAPAFPPIAGQHPAYTSAQLEAWKSGRRSNSPAGLMHDVAARLSSDDIRAVADYLATLPPRQSEYADPVPLDRRRAQNE